EALEAIRRGDILARDFIAEKTAPKICPKAFRKRNLRGGGINPPVRPEPRALSPFSAPRPPVPALPAGDGFVFSGHAKQDTMLRSAELRIAQNAPPAGCSAAEAQGYTRWLASHHYENFNVVSWLLPRELHQHFYNLYAYCRWA